MGYGDRVVDVGEAIDAREPGLGATQQCFQTVAGALRLGSEGAVGIPPRGYTRQILNRCLSESRTRRRLRTLEERFARRIARARLEAVNGEKHRPVVRAEVPDLGCDLG